ncbi:hypothetical protein AMECASPLE_016849 [Ameca splendens]|uniref:Uncharacterized protein n=1 Tax=Ameca splendens TaxID=208324 RepID=A0ABV0YDD4_9TELE
MRVEFLSDQGFPLVPTLEPCLTEGFGVRSAARQKTARAPAIPPMVSELKGVRPLKERRGAFLASFCSVA